MSRQLLITRYSNPEVIRSYLWKQFEKASEDFDIGELGQFYCYFKFRKIDIGKNHPI
jgi:hypothetical protein